MTSSSFGALMKFRRVKLGLSTAQVAHRVECLGQRLDVVRLEDGLLAAPTPAQLRALAAALNWSPALLQAASGAPLATPGRNPFDPLPFDPETSEPSVSAMRTEVEGLRDLQVALQEWTEDLLDRLRASDPPVA